ncbi:hypothetical protein [Stygiolobus caldivivus]|uniref:tRNA-ribosyltransferase n=1 Tax=Stygiolobus caldivivus TaxID=2824673 RepID=A0A8D5UA74_9CREN|nr:hypothetical protein [Stygiolobus caldivivus]BCU71484.1 hypothetical protein KN1_27810 [Stygiolobus caldivivus]
MKVILGMPDLRIPIWKLGTPIMINQLREIERTWDNETWVDSGGYQIMRKGIKIDVNDVIKRYKNVGGDYFISLDIPTPVCSPPAKETFEYYLKLYEAEIDVIPVIHAYPLDFIDKALDFYNSHPPKVIAYGGVVPPLLHRGIGRTTIIAMYHYLRNKTKNLHVMGAGSPFMRKVFYNADSVDTSTYRVKGAMGMVLIPGKGEKYVGKRKIKWHVRSAKSDELEELFKFLETTNFPFEVNLDNWINRTLINAWVVLKSDYTRRRPEIIKSEEIGKMSLEQIRDLNVCGELILPSSSSR